MKTQHIHRMAEAGRHRWKSSASLLRRVSSVSLFRLLTMMLNGTELRISPWDTPPVARVQLNFIDMVTILWALQFLQFSVPFTVHFLVCTSLACLQGWMGCRAESLTKVSNIHHCWPVHWASHWKLSGWLSTISPASKSMLTTLNHLNIFQMFENSFQEDAIHHLPSDQGKSDWECNFPDPPWRLEWHLLSSPQELLLMAMTFQRQWSHNYLHTWIWSTWSDTSL